MSSHSKLSSSGAHNLQLLQRIVELIEQIPLAINAKTSQVRVLAQYVHVDVILCIIQCIARPLLKMVIKLLCAHQFINISDDIAYAVWLPVTEPFPLLVQRGLVQPPTQLHRHPRAMV